MSNRQFFKALTAILLTALILLGMRLALWQTGVNAYREEKKEVVHFMLPESGQFTEISTDGEDESIQKIYKSQAGYVIEVRTPGYGGDMVVMVGVSSEGQVKGLTIRKMQETLGLGTQALTDTDFLARFLNTQGDVQIGEDVDALTGATVTSKAIARAVNTAVGYVTGADTSSGATSWGG